MPNDNLSSGFKYNRVLRIYSKLLNGEVINKLMRQSIMVSLSAQYSVISRIFAASLRIMPMRAEYTKSWFTAKN